MPPDRDLSILDRFHVAAAIPAEFKTADLGDTRLTDRVQGIVASLGRTPRKSILAACSEWAETKATYRFCDNETVDPPDILAAHTDAVPSPIEVKTVRLVTLAVLQLWRGAMESGNLDRLQDPNPP